MAFPQHNSLKNDKIKKELHNKLLAISLTEQFYYATRTIPGAKWGYQQITAQGERNKNQYHHYTRWEVKFCLTGCIFVGKLVYSSPSKADSASLSSYHLTDNFEATEIQHGRG